MAEKRKKTNLSDKAKQAFGIEILSEGIQEKVWRKILEEVKRKHR